MEPSKDYDEIGAVLRQLTQAYADHDADTIAAAYAPDAVIYDLAPPLARRGINRDAVADWLAGWEGPIRIETRDLEISVDGALGFASALTRIQGRQGGEAQDMWFRSTQCFRNSGGRWRIVCEHASVPFYMDGSYRAAIDLQP